MDAHTVIERLKAHEQQLRGMGILRLSLFGSTARGEAGPDSDVDLAATFDPDARIGMFKFFEIEDSLRALLGVPVDLVGEPTRRPRFQQQIDRDRMHVF